MAEAWDITARRKAFCSRFRRTAICANFGAFCRPGSVKTVSNEPDSYLTLRVRR
jgi:hypothetical protein